MKNVDAFLAEVVEVCRKHGLAIGHEDGHGAFEVRDFSEHHADWLMDASDMTSRAEGVPGSPGEENA